MDKPRTHALLTVLELAIAITAVLLDLLIPTLVVLAVMGVSLLLRRDKLATMGIIKPEKPARMVVTVLALTVLWTLLTVGFTMPLLNRLTGTTQDMSAFESLKGDVGQLALYLAAGWILAALGEEVAYRGFFQTRLTELFGGGSVGLALSVLLSSLLFGLAHSEQGLIGVVLTTLDALFFSLLKIRYRGCIWPAVLAHGLSNTIGFVTFFLIGPVYGLW